MKRKALLFFLLLVVTIPGSMLIQTETICPLFLPFEGELIPFESRYISQYHPLDGPVQPRNFCRYTKNSGTYMVDRDARQAWSLVSHARLGYPIAGVTRVTHIVFRNVNDDYLSISDNPGDEVIGEYILTRYALYTNFTWLEVDNDYPPAVLLTNIVGNPYRGGTYDTYLYFADGKLARVVDLNGSQA